MPILGSFISLYIYHHALLHLYIFPCNAYLLDPLPLYMHLHPFTPHHPLSSCSSCILRSCTPHPACIALPTTKFDSLCVHVKRNVGGKRYGASSTEGPRSGSGGRCTSARRGPVTQATATENARRAGLRGNARMARTPRHASMVRHHPIHPAGLPT
jgi:hypothetical protein